MKKLIIVLMVVAVASFLFVGCLGVTPSVDDVDDVDDVVDVAKTDTPFITEITNVTLAATTTQYSNSPAVTGVGVAGAIIKVYIDGVQTGVSSTGTTGAFGPISVTMVTLKEGVKKLYVTATQPGLAESDKSTEHTFTYDKTAPTLASAVADSSDQTITVTFSEDVNMAGPTASAASWAASALNLLNWTVNINGGVDETLSSAYVFSKISDKVVRITIPSTGTTIVLGQVSTLGVLTVEDKATNPILARSYVTCLAIP